ncbi:MAG: FeoB-associated Cys-rich membrane protein [Akkermansia sp.]|nr:FeoB-associated Cys-rich membrane protein [Akkermansia sp.]
MGDIIVILILVAITAWIILSMLRKKNNCGGCCGSCDGCGGTCGKSRDDKHQH